MRNISRGTKHMSYLALYLSLLSLSLYFSSSSCTELDYDTRDILPCDDIQFCVFGTTKNATGYLTCSDPLDEIVYASSVQCSLYIYNLLSTLQTSIRNTIRPSIAALQTQVTVLTTKLNSLNTSSIIPIPVTSAPTIQCTCNSPSMKDHTQLFWLTMTTLLITGLIFIDNALTKIIQHIHIRDHVQLANSDIHLIPKLTPSPPKASMSASEKYYPVVDGSD